MTASLLASLANPEGRDAISGLAERDSGRVLSARAFTEPPTETAPSLKFDNRYTEEELALVQSVPLVIRTYWSADGLWELPAFTLADVLKGDKGETVRLI